MRLQPRSAPAAQVAKGFPWLLLLIGWAIVAAITCYRITNNLGSTPLYADTDDAMRVTVVRDFLNGQPWHDIVQHRLNTPFGAEIHWSRLVDLPIAALTLLVRPFAGEWTQTVVAYIWPMLLLLLMLGVSARLCMALAGRAGFLPGLILPALSPAVTAEFIPGRMDHHSVQAILALVMALGAVEALRRPRWAILAGVAGATSLAVGTEGLPMVVAAILAFALAWVIDTRNVEALRHFGGSFALAALVHLVVALPPDRWLLPQCDALSVVFVAAAVGVGLLFLLLGALPLARRPAWLRLTLGLLLGGALLAGLLVFFPECRRGPYAAVDPWLVTNWISIISEAKTLWASYPGYPSYTVASAIPCLAAAVFLLAVLWKGEGATRARWAVWGLFFLIAVAIMLLQIRGARIATLLAVPGGAGLVVAARDWYLRRPRNLGRAAGLLVAWLLFAGFPISIGWSHLLPYITAPGTGGGSPSKFPCLQPDAFTDLAALPAQRLMAPIDLGAHLLLYTPHSVVAAPYHRNEEGVLDTFRFLNNPIDEARQILEARGIGMVVVCPAMPELRGIGGTAPDSFVRLFATDALPGWLREVTPSGSVLRLFQVIPDGEVEPNVSDRRVTGWVPVTGWLPGG